MEADAEKLLKAFGTLEFFAVCYLTISCTLPTHFQALATRSHSFLSSSDNPQERNFSGHVIHSAPALSEQSPFAPSVPSSRNFLG